jgi:hypothetical protein
MQVSVVEWYSALIYQVLVCVIRHPKVFIVGMTVLC